MNANTRMVRAMMIGLVIGAFAAVGQVAAQGPVLPAGSGGMPPYPPPYDMSYGSYGQMPYIEKSATVAEGYFNGVSKVIRAEGDYNLSTAQAAVNAQEALRQNILNRQAIVKAYFELRKMNRDYRAAERHPGLQRDSRAPVAQAERPRPLLPQELDASTGKVRWPKLLAADTHAENREMLDEYFATRAEKRAMSTREMAELRSAVLGMVADLKAQRRAATPADYETATQFLRSLAYEGQHAVGESPQLVASSR